ncbi:RES family NAD+ phosphorylase [Streptomyces sp. NPDC054904]|uniref:RES family NAD+ phosphorylase n=1 Tax=unclassified Streptomyces TaxID=2593676 RepID=UPI002481A8C1|nr:MULTISPECIES: RES family NAD+ phosphorylase [unclassified Streptomyces]MDA5285309.1 RES family NAD+ phosphorylase [Streptomyces sp. Isolate_45]MDX2391347.1 RES family NAD+ phosphorylase [Streptomyces sp. DK15]
MTRVLPPSAYELRPRYHVLPMGTLLWRVHTAARPAEEFNPRPADLHFGGSRFDSTVLDPYPFLYAGDSATTALAETLLRSMPFDPERGLRLVPYAAVHGRALSVMRTRCEVSLVSLIDEHDLAAVCQDSGLLEDEQDYPKARRWAGEIRVQAPASMGLIWQSRRNRPRHALVLFGDRFAACDGKPLETLPDDGIEDLGSRAGVERVNALLEPLRSAISFGGRD